MGAKHWRIVCLCGIVVLGRCVTRRMATIMATRPPDSPGLTSAGAGPTGPPGRGQWLRSARLRNSKPKTIKTKSNDGSGDGIGAPCMATRWNSSMEPATPEYDLLAEMVNRFAAHGIPLLLYGGSLLGARRHFGIMPWDWDLDFIVFETNTSKINPVLDTFLERNVTWRYNDDGDGPGTTGFGYHVDTPHRYLDLWLYAPLNSTHVGCVGRDDGCRRWYKRFMPNTPPPADKIDLVLPCSHLPFGPWMFPSPHNAEAVLDRLYTPNWREQCKGWMRGKTTCDSLRGNHSFVYEEGTVHTLKNGSTVIESFDVINGTYHPIAKR